MTHEKLLAKIQSNYEENKHFRDQPDWKSFDALRAVIELHKPFVREDEKIVCNLGCSDEGGYLESYPCPTIQAIKKELQ